MQVGYLPDPEGHPAWGNIKALLERARRYNPVEIYEPGDVVWLAIEDKTIWAAMVSRLNHGVAEIICVSGTKLDAWLPQWAAIFEEWARNCGADWLECRGRKGWARFAERFGWQFSHHDKDGLPVFEKELN